MLFSEPQKLHPVALIQVFGKVFKELITRAWPVLIALFFQLGKTNEDEPGNLHYYILGAIALTTISGVIRFLTYRWHIQDNTVLISYGLLRKVNVKIPFDRIQFIDIQQPFYYQLFGVAKVALNTAGSKTKEAEITAVSKATAEEVAQFIDGQKEEANAAESIDAQETTPKTPTITKEWIALDVIGLFIVGLFANHVRTFFVVLGFGVYLSSQISEVLESPEIEEDLAQIYDQIPSTMGFYGTMILGVFGAIVVFTCIMTVIRFFNFKLTQEDATYFVKYGLFKVQTRQFNAHKIQIITTAQGPVFKALGIKRFLIQQAKSDARAKKEDLSVPGVPAKMMDAFLEHFFKIKPGYTHIGSIQRVLFLSTRLGLPVAVAFCAAGWFFNVNFYWGALVFPFILVHSFLNWKFQGLYLNPNILSTRKQVLYEKNASLLHQKIQAVHVSSNLFQRRKGLASIKIETAGGWTKLSYIQRDQANAIANYLLYKTETA